MPNSYYEKIVKNMPMGLDRQVMSVLQHHVGSANRISRGDLVRAVFFKECGKDSTEDRQVREVISQLQNEHPILSDSGKGGYFLAGNLVELNAYANEIISRARELESKARKLRAAGEEMFGPAQNVPLF